MEKGKELSKKRRQRNLGKRKEALEEMQHAQFL